MVTARRSTTDNFTANTSGSARGGVELLERPRASAGYSTVAPVRENNLNDAKERMQRNLDKLMNYDRYAERQAEEAAVEEKAVMEETVSVAEEDIRPTSTTMQFGENIDQIREEMKQATAVESESSYQLNSKGKLAVILYSLAVTIILALIILNTGVLAKLSNSNTAKAAELNATIERFNEVTTKIESISDSNYIINVAENEYGMVKK
ncbi:MAG: hypothetical protein IKA11_00640 [Clostridia bacterium]|nr:hypothetical protein [Clostridia bacterium]